MNMRLRLVWVVVTSIAWLGSGGSADELTRIELKENLGFSYAPQVVHCRAELPRGRSRDTSRCALKKTSGQPVLAQFKPMDRWDDGSLRHVKVSFIAVLEPYAAEVYVVDDSGQGAKDDGTLTIQRTADTIILSSPLAAAEIPAMSKAFSPDEAQPDAFPPPVSRIRGKRDWYGRGRLWLDSSFVLKERSVAVADDGPVYKRVTVTSTFTKGAKLNTFMGDTCTHTAEITLCRGEELIRVMETFAFPFTDISPLEFAFDFYPGLEPDTSVCRPVYSATGPTWDVGSYWDLYPYEGPMYPISYGRDDTLGFLSPWVAVPQNWVHFACYNGHRGDQAEMVGVIITAPDRWDHIAYAWPEEAWKLNQSPHAFFTLKKVNDVRVSIEKGGGLTAHFPLHTGTREWAFFVAGPFPRTQEKEVTKAGKTEKSVNQAAPRDYLKAKASHYYANSLDRVKDWVLSWPEDAQVTYPHLYRDRSEWPRLCDQFRAWGLPIPSLDDPQAQARLKDAVLKRVEDTVKTMFVNPGPPHHIASAVYPSANLADLLLGTGALTDEERARLKARLAYMAYLLNWRSYWAPEKGYGSTPNMSSFAYDAVGLIGLLLADHPESPRWIRACTRQIDRELASWASEDGAWIEAPHYVRAAWQEHTMLMLALKQAGARDYFRNPKVRRFFEYYFTLQTPPDPDGNRQRGVPCIGRSYDIEQVEEFNLWARGLVDVDPSLAGAMQWMWREQGYGSPEEMKGKIFKAYGAGHSAWFNETPFKWVALNDPFIRPEPPTQPGLVLGGRFDGFGAIFNSHFGGPKETKLYFREGHHFYTDMDQGSIVFWAKGAPLVMDHGYGEFHPWFHSRVCVNHMWEDDLGEVLSCMSGKGGAMVQGHLKVTRLAPREHPWVKEWPMKPEPFNGRSPETDWTRRVLFLKDADPDGPNYLVMRDTVRGELPTEWVLWVYGTVQDSQSTPIHVTGKHGVDLLVYLLDPDKGRVNTGRIDFSQEPSSIPRRKQTLIHMQRPPGRGALAVLYPLLPGGKRPDVTVIGNGAGVKLSIGQRTDWLFVPEQSAAVTVDGVEFRGHAAAFSKRPEGAYYLVETGSALKAEGLGVVSNVPLELFVRGNRIDGMANARDMEPRIRLEGPVAGRIASMQAGAGSETSVKSDGNAVELAIPSPDGTFHLTLK